MRAVVCTTITGNVVEVVVGLGAGTVAIAASAMPIAALTGERSIEPSDCCSGES